MFRGGGYYLCHIGSSNIQAENQKISRGISPEGVKDKNTKITRLWLIRIPFRRSTGRPQL